MTAGDAGFDTRRSRRLVAVVVGLVFAASACGADPAALDDGRQPSSSPSPSRSAASASATPTSDATIAPSQSGPASPSPIAAPTATITPPALATAAPYAPVAGEVLPDAKLLAATIAATLTTYAPEDTPDAIAARVATDDESRDELAEAAGPLFLAGHRSVGTVVYPQLGGLTEDRTSVMVVVRQDLLGDGDLSSVTRTLDVRLRRVDDEWTFDRLASAGGEPPDEPVDRSAAARAVLADERITLPDSAHWDIERGVASQRLLETMLAMAEQFPYAVAVVESGHPYHVFETDRVSNHSVGRAVDVYAVDGQPVVSQRGENSPAHDLASHLYDAGVPELGSPWTFGSDGRAFTNTVHQDHLHVGFDS